MRRFLLAATLFALIGMTSALADDPPVQVVPSAQPKLIPSGLPTTRITTAATLDEEREILEAQRDTKKAYLRAAELDLKAAETNLHRIDRIAESGATKEEVGKAKLAFEAAKAQVAIQADELKKVEVKIELARKRFEEAKAVAILKANGKVVEAGGLIIGMTEFGRIQILRGVSEVQPPIAQVSESKIAVFNMAKVMKEYEKAKSQVNQLKEERKQLSLDLVALTAKHVKTQQDIQNPLNANIKEQLQERQVELTRQIEDKDRQINKKLNDKSLALISELYEEIKLVVDKTAAEKGYHIVFAYPDATSPDDLKSPYVKELKLKPPAAQPFYAAKRIDITDEVIQTLNTRYTAPHILKSLALPTRFHISQWR